MQRFLVCLSLTTAFFLAAPAHAGPISNGFVPTYPAYMHMILSDLRTDSLNADKEDESAKGSD